MPGSRRHNFLDPNWRETGDTLHRSLPLPNAKLLPTHVAKLAAARTTDIRGGMSARDIFQSPRTSPSSTAPLLDDLQTVCKSFVRLTLHAVVRVASSR